MSLLKLLVLSRRILFIPGYNLHLLLQYNYAINIKNHYLLNARTYCDEIELQALLKGISVKHYFGFRFIIEL